jgi:glycosyltransferase involved in cell wall biosynthesis
VSDSKVGVLHLVDSLASGGTEHVAVKLANNLPKDRYRAFLCASRQSGPLQNQIQPHVTFYDLRRNGRFDIFAIVKLSRFTHRERIRIIHAHSSSLFLGSILGLLNPELHLVWHDHFGLQGIESRPAHLYLFFIRRANAIFAVTRELARWSVQSLGVSQERVHYLPNFVETQTPFNISLDLPGKQGKRVVCVANIRAQKDHFTLLRALAQVVKVEPQAHLILVGANTDLHLAEQAREESRRLGLESNLTWLGPREDVQDILANCDIGVLSSISEGFPVVLLEYGRAGLAVVATQVGECTEILDDGNAGILVPPSNPDSLAAALLRLLQSPEMRTQLGEQLRERVEQNYSVGSIMKQVCQVYERIL